MIRERNNGGTDAQDHAAREAPLNGALIDFVVDMVSLLLCFCCFVLLSFFCVASDADVLPLCFASVVRFCVVVLCLWFVLLCVVMFVWFCYVLS